MIKDDIASIKEAKLTIKKHEKDLAWHKKMLKKLEN
jgi:hypothetical protein